MCLIFIAIDSHPRYPLVVAANRDEYFNRPTEPLHKWPGSPIIAGKDLTAGGTWMGVTESGRFAALTNYRDPANITLNPISRGHLVKDFLEGDTHPQKYLDTLTHKRTQYQGFNLIVGTFGELWYWSNNRDKPPEKLSSGIHGLSNHLLNTPWPKVSQGKKDFKAVLQENQPEKTLLDVLTDQKTADDSDLPNTGIGLELERALSSRFIHIPSGNYGTRCSTLLLCDNKGGFTITEQTWDSETQPTELKTLHFPE